jgi:hydroxyacylglutathione hydrolase
MMKEPIVLNLGFVNAYLLSVQDGYILIDSGMPFQWATLESDLRKAGALPDRLKLAVITHGDIDHTGGCANLQKKYKVPIAIHPGDREQVETGKRLVRESGGRMGKLLTAASRMAGNLQKRAPMVAYEIFQPDVLLADGQSLAPYGLDATVLHLPGHTPGSIAILTADGALFVGDTLANRGGSYMPPFIQDRNNLRASIERLKGLHATTIYPGHGKPFPFAKIRSFNVEFHDGG